MVIYTHCLQTFPAMLPPMVPSYVCHGIHELLLWTLLHSRLQYLVATHHL